MCRAVLARDSHRARAVPDAAPVELHLPLPLRVCHGRENAGIEEVARRKGHADALARPAPAVQERACAVLVVSLEHPAKSAATGGASVARQQRGSGSSGGGSGGTLSSSYMFNVKQRKF